MSVNTIGKPMTRVDGRAKVTGRARYAADFNQPGQLYAVIVSATVGLGRITGIQAAEVERMPGVVALITHRNAEKLAYLPHKAGIDPATGERLHVLQDDTVRFYGQPVALVVADTLDHAERIRPETLQDDAAGDLALAVELGDAAPLIRPDLDPGDI